MRRDFANEVSSIQKIKRADLVEKDFILHQILLDLSKNEFFTENFAFKGGTCLIKCYLGYFRFSEDIDFTWKQQEVFKGKSQKEIRRYLSRTIDKLGVILTDIAAKRGLDFKCEKHNKTYVELGGGNKTCTFKIWYLSEILDHRSFVKVQITFVEWLYSDPQKIELKSLLDKKHEKINELFPEHEEYLQRIVFDAYPVTEILCEKVRAILTREGVKARDFLDVYQICQMYGIKLQDIHDCVVGKTQFMLSRYQKYRNSFAKKKNIVLSEDTFTWGEERGLLLQNFDKIGFYRFLRELREFLRKIITELS